LLAAMRLERGQRVASAAGSCASAVLMPSRPADTPPASTLRQNTALDEGGEHVLHQWRQAGAGDIFGLGKEVGGVLLQQAIQRGVFWAVALVVDSNCKLQVQAPEPDGREHPLLADSGSPVERG